MASGSHLEPVFESALAARSRHLSQFRLGAAAVALGAHRRGDEAECDARTKLELKALELKFSLLSSYAGLRPAAHGQASRSERLQLS